MLPAQHTDPMYAEAVGKSLPKFPQNKNRSNMELWEQEMELKLMEAKLGNYSCLDHTELADMSESERVGSAQLYGVLLAKQGPLSVQPELRTMLVRLMRRDPVFRQHGARGRHIFSAGD